MDLVQLRYFAQVAQLKSFTKASEALHITQPALTRQVLLLEEELGVQLLFRHSRGAEPTEAGVKLLAGAESIFRVVRDVTVEVAESSGRVAGTLRIGFPPSLGGFVIGMAVDAFQRKYPEVTFELREGLSNELRDHLLADRLDLAVLMIEADPPLVSVPLCAEELWVLQPPSGRILNSPRTYTLKMLAKQPLIQPGRTQLVRQYIESVALGQGISLHIVAEADALQVTKDLVRRGVGVHISPYSGIAADIKRGDFSGGPVQGLVISRYLVRRMDRPITLGIAKFQEAMLETIQALHKSDHAIRPVTTTERKKKGRSN
ncbi:LysR family transcriptional regulator [Cupriavidus sp. TA19]|uniref:LysR family transcriptional regulator n=1 Tax=Cupriavidus sp. TA19 TaxID=701108 RepID=UPI0027294E57|nr:LysR family transcriptional regulator [Cupriavidus sp. TA19]GLC97773.1 LysR family transcriptional regulator [Cupriavidus sp. TA19]